MYRDTFNPKRHREQKKYFKTLSYDDEDLDKVDRSDEGLYVASIPNFHRYSKSTQSYVLLDLARKMLERAVKKVADDNYIAKRKSFSTRIVDVQNTLNNLQNLLNDVDGCLDEVIEKTGAGFGKKFVKAELNE